MKNRILVTSGMILLAVSLAVIFGARHRGSGPAYQVKTAFRAWSLRTGLSQVVYRDRDDGRLMLLDPLVGSVSQVGTEKHYQRIAVNPREPLIACSFYDNAARTRRAYILDLFRVETVGEISLPEDTDWVEHMAWSCDGRSIALAVVRTQEARERTAASQYFLMTLGATDWQEARRIDLLPPAQCPDVTGVFWDTSGTRLLVSFSDSGNTFAEGLTQSIAVETGKVEKTYPYTIEAFAPDGAKVVFDHARMQYSVLLASGEVETRMPAETILYQFHITPDSRFVLYWRGYVPFGFGDFTPTYELWCRDLCTHRSARLVTMPEGSSPGDFSLVRRLGTAGANASPD